MKISNLHKSYGKFSLQVEDLSLPAGEIYGIIGPNGCGKTTLMKAIAGLLEPDSGHIDYNGLTPRDITMVFRKQYLIHDTVLHNLVYPLKIRGIKPDEELVKRYLDIAGLWESREEYAPGLSSGQQQKLTLVRALIFSPGLVLIDEAFSNLDMESAATFEQLILEKQRSSPATYIICAHQLSHIQRLCGYILFMHSGRIETQGPASQMLTQPENSKLKSYLQYASLKEGVTD
ncbi:MAG: ABC transporter ATP-binding protein [Oscillospiraceae bacterium]|nr:ABC transporter ATP-binding protein [Oscillospiraceae bacterium]